MRKFHAVIEPNGKMPADEFISAIERMEITFTIGEHATVQDPRETVEINLRSLGVYYYVAITSLEEVSGECSGLTTAPDSPHLRDAPYDPTAPCEICRNPHSRYPDVASRNGTYFWPGHEYIIRTLIPPQKRVREWRMGYLGFGAGMEFSARGPDRTHGGQYGGTQTLDLQHIVYAEEVVRDDKLRHTGKMMEPVERMSQK